MIIKSNVHTKPAQKGQLLRAKAKLLSSLFFHRENLFKIYIAKPHTMDYSCFNSCFLDVTEADEFLKVLQTMYCCQMPIKKVYWTIKRSQLVASMVSSNSL
jgi:hypothetical protein